MELLLTDGYLLVRPDQLIDLKGAPVAADRYALVTFDDGYEDFFHCAWPVLRELQIPVTLFIISDYVAGWNDWDPIRASRCRHLDLDQLRALQAEGVSFGSHSRTHRPLSFLLRRAALLSEIQGSKHKLEDIFGVPIRTMAYPGGHVSRRVRNLTARHYELGFATHLGAKGRFGDPYLIPRFDPSFCSEIDDFRRELQVYSGLVNGQW
jgi:peptidoglycan/xylan/chitin deacetylase (PgdA/CDA1 family)